MKMYLDTSTPTTILRLDDKEYAWESGRDLAENLHAFLRDKLAENGAELADISEITFFSGPGSFTGLRIGAAVVNALASELDVPLYDHHGNKVPVILPDYAREANISKPRK
ncbi:tRNA (adenosine(37)-N6)-threonylcarbamoyltransferase complex dimerization subunit type 1 TsaB [Candidatus Saccharibacteria bacterium]|nr:tRNA (adenosine(37)-N6)-threonylcarbamoyltransferase complex dimerization subunit type 1 TsaB [Candidatus Saccharibacteria bacterium]